MPYNKQLRGDLQGTIFVACDKLTAGLRHDLRLPQRFKTCFKMLRHFSDVHTNRKSCRRPVVSLSHATKIVPCKSALTSRDCSGRTGKYWPEVVAVRTERMNTRRCTSVLNTKEKSKRFAGASINLSGRHANYSHGAKQCSLLPHVFVVICVVCGGNMKEYFL